MPKHSFEGLLLNAIDEGLSALGESPKRVVYFYLEKKFNINRREIPDKIEDFVEALEKIFGLGAKFLQILIIKQLYQKIEKNLEWNEEQTDLTFTEYIVAARRSYLKKTQVQVQYSTKEGMLIQKEKR
ncbi:MAG: hypothetical protein OEX77_04635 [Candidatus Bathyarchaeota archaeon]|nr:hypothetical protein [Candidatus Bathyarchaeota archaeon]MDH5733423.1 hypothetical protein [Candidatus Bathyarchaeota archaeon]